MNQFSLTMVTHACIKVEGAFGGLLCDPWFLNEPIYGLSTWKYPEATMSPEAVIDGLTHVFITHSHEDHFHIPSIDLLPRDLTILLPEYDWHPGLRAQTVERTMREMGFCNIRKLRSWEPTRLGEDMVVTVIPAAPAKPWDWENAGLVIEHPDCRILNMNDCPSDDATYAEVNRRFGHFDLMLIQYAGVTIFPGRFRMTEDEIRAAVQHRRTKMTEQDRAVRLLSLDRLVPFAGDFCWLDDRLLHCNWACRATPAIFWEWLEEYHAQRTFELMLMNPGDRWTPGGGLDVRGRKIGWEHYLDDIARLKRRFQPRVDAIDAWLRASSIDRLEERSRAYTARLERWIGRQDIDFSTSMRVRVEGPGGDFDFSMRIDPENGLRITWDDRAPVDQTIFIPVRHWASLLEAKLSLSLLAWPSEVEQHVPYRLDLAKFWFWFEYYADLLNRNPQVIIERIQHPWLTDTVRPHLGVPDAPEAPVEEPDAPEASPLAKPALEPAT